MSGRNERFVRAAKRLLLFQAGAAALAVGITGWAAFEVAGLVRERDALSGRVAELERARQAQAPFNAFPGTEPLPPPPPTSPATAPVARTDPGRQPPDAVQGPAPPPPAPVPSPPPPPSPQPSPQPPPPPAPPPPSPPPAPPAPRECQSVERRPIVCVPPFRRTPVPGVCLDGNNRPMRCPPRLREPEQPNDPNRQQPPTRR